MSDDIPTPPDAQPSEEQIAIELALKSAPGFEVTPAVSYGVSRKFDFSSTSIPEDLLPTAVDVMNSVVDYLEKPIILDDFPNHDARRDWVKRNEKELQEKYGSQAGRQFKSYLGQNKAKASSITEAYSGIDMLSMFVENNDHINQLASIYDANFAHKPTGRFVEMEDQDGKKVKIPETSSPWDTMPKDDKRVVLNNFSSELANLVRSLSKSRE